MRVEDDDDRLQRIVIEARLERPELTLEVVEDLRAEVSAGALAVVLQCEVGRVRLAVSFVDQALAGELVDLALERVVRLQVVGPPPLGQGFLGALLPVVHVAEERVQVRVVGVVDERALESRPGE